MRAKEFVSEGKSHDFMAGHCHVMAIALKQLHPDWQIRAHVGYDDDEADDTEYRVDHVYTVAPDGTAYDCRGRFSNEQQLVGPDTTGGVDTQYVNFGPEEIKQAIQRGELKRFSKQDLTNAMQVGKQVVAQNSLTEYKNTPLQDYNGLQFMIDSNHPYLRVEAFAPGSGQQLAQVDFKIDDQDELHPEDLHVEERWRGQGIAQIMYDFVKSKGYTIHRSWSQTDAGSEFWNKHRGQKRVWEQGVAEGKQPGQPVVDAILKVMPIAQEIWFHGSRATRSHRKNSDTDILVIVPDDLVGNQYLGAVRILQKLSTHFDNHDIQPTKSGTNIHRIAQEEGRLLWSNKQVVAENFADGRNPQDKGDSKRHGINTKASVSSLRKTAKQGGRKGQLAHWLANMKSGRAKKKKTNETVIGTLHFPKLIIAVDDHAIDRTRTRGISPASIDQSLRKLNSIADQLGQMESSNTVWVYDVSNNLALGLRRTSSRDMRFTLKTVVADRPYDGTTPIIELTS